MVDRLRLTKFPLCLFIGCSTFFGFILANPVLGGSSLSISFAVLLLAMGGATVNNLQEYRLDALMERTRQRPLVKGKISLLEAVILGMLFVGTGLFALQLFSGKWQVSGLGLIAIVMYNVIYTPLKKHSVFAIVPGALCGAFPPVIGWLAGGGGLYSYYNLLLFTLFLLWQIPHFWLVMLRYSGDYSNNSIPSLLAELDESRIRRLSIIWVGALVTTMLMFILSPFHLKTVFWVAVVINAVLLFIIFAIGLATKGERYKFLFLLLNGSLFVHMILVGSGRYFS